MEAFDTRKTQLIEHNLAEYGDKYHQLRWASAEEIEEASGERSAILKSLEGRVRLGYNNSKLDMSAMSPGCSICGEGEWSCLFINGKCNCRCFYCPTQQEELGVPTTNTVPFSRTIDYVDYVEKFGFKGVSISGGEPLLTLDSTLDFIRGVRHRMGSQVYLWLYTNGTLATREKLALLREAGLDEIRFDIGATKYSLDKARMAAGIIPSVTVEIPAIPEDYEIMKTKLTEMQEAGIRYLNLHQLRLTPNNFPNLITRDYRFLHGEKVTVLDSELTALRLIRYARENEITLPINYCSFAYKNRFQKSAARRRNGEYVRKPYEDLTPAGYIRTLGLVAEPDILIRQAEIFQAGNAAKESWQMLSHRLSFSALLWDMVSFENARLDIGYAQGRILPGVTYRNPFREIELNSNHQVYIEREKAAHLFELTAKEASRFRQIFLKNEDISFTGSPWQEIAGYEQIPQGLQEYF